VTLEAIEVLAQLGVPRDDAVRRLRDIREAEPEIASADQLVRAVFRRK